MSNIATLIDFNPNRAVNEDRQLVEFKKKDLTLIKARISPTIAFVESIDALERPLFFHKYPRLSKFWEVILVAFTWTFDPRYFLSYIIFLVIVLYGYGQKNIRS